MTLAKHFIKDAATGEATTIEATVGEQAASEAALAVALQGEQTTAALVAERNGAVSDLATQYQAAIARLDAISTNGGTYTAAQVRDAVVDMARIQARMLKLVKAALT